MKLKNAYSAWRRDFDWNFRNLLAEGLGARL